MNLRHGGWLAALVAAIVLAFSQAVFGQEMQAMPTVIDGSKFLDATASDGGLQKAIDAAPRGGTLFLPAGKYVLKRSLMLKSDITLSGVGAETVLTTPPVLPCARLAGDAAKGAREVRLADAGGFEPGMEVTVRDVQRTGWHATFAVVTEVRGDAVRFDQPLKFDYAAAQEAQMAHAFPALTARDATNLTIQLLRIVGRPPHPPLLPRNLFVHSAIHLVGCTKALIARCAVESWHSDGFSVQGGGETLVLENVARGNVGHGFHPGTGLQDSCWSGNLGEGNGNFGLYYCWDNRRVIVSRNRFIANARYGIGRLGDGRDQDCLATDNLCERNGLAGIHSGMFGDCKLNFIVANRLVNNCQSKPGAAILLQKSQQNVVARNEISDDQAQPTQVIGIEEMSDGSDHNYIVANIVSGAREAAIRRGENTVVEDAFPGSIPPERLKVLDELLQREAENWAAWQQRRATIVPPATR